MASFLGGVFGRVAGALIQRGLRFVIDTLEGRTGVRLSVEAVQELQERVSIQTVRAMERDIARMYEASLKRTIQQRRLVRTGRLANRTRVLRRLKARRVGRGAIQAPAPGSVTFVPKFPKRRGAQYGYIVDRTRKGMDFIDEAAQDVLDSDEFREYTETLWLRVAAAELKRQGG